MNFQKSKNKRCPLSSTLCRLSSLSLNLLGMGSYRIAHQHTRLSDSAVSDEQQLEEVIAKWRGRRGIRVRPGEGAGGEEGAEKLLFLMVIVHGFLCNKTNKRVFLVKNFFLYLLTKIDKNFFKCLKKNLIFLTLD